MTNVFFTADLHVGHERIIELAKRPFASVAEMDEALVARWNAVVGASDLVWVLGDYALGDRARGLARLSTMNGRKRLVSGNHDACWPGLRNGCNHLPAYLEAGFEAVTPFATAKLPPTAEGRRGRNVLLSHFPYAADHTDEARFEQFRLRDCGEWLIHGHVHEAYTLADRGVNVGVDRWDFAPVPAIEVARLIDEAEAGTPS